MDSLLAGFRRWRARPARRPRALLVPRSALSSLLLATATACSGRAPERPVSDFSREFADGARHVQRFADKQRTAPGTMSDREVIAAGYMERLRLGMGSPFRLMEYALLDPRLTPSTRTSLVWALLDATQGGRAYELDPRALIRVGADPGQRDVAAARRHLALIEDAVLAAEEPRAGELAVREAYRLAAASHAVSPSAPILAASAAALARDRELARRDAERLLTAAVRRGKHPFAVLVEWRTQRRFEVEAPSGAPRDAALEDAAGRLAVRLLERVEAVRDGSGGEPQTPVEKSGLPRLTEASARRLAKLARKQFYPTQAPVWITVQRYDEELRRAAMDASSAHAVERLLERGKTEETLVAEYASLGDAPAPVRESAALAALEASVAMRTYAQERVWFPGFTAPSDVDLKRAFGLRKVEFDASVAAAWRPYYRRMLWDALADLELVLPSLDLRGAAFKIGATGREGAALAIHDPYGRTIALPPESGAGAIAHEVGHDLDWQVAHARYRTRAAYGTEYAVRTGRADRFATAARRMPTPPEVPMRGGAEVQRRYAQRPPEIFARTFDGYIAAALAERGRSNGYLTAAQDELLGGHGLALTPGARDDAAPFMEMLMVASPVPDAERREFLARRAAERVPSAFETAGRIASRAPAALPSPATVRPAPGMAELLAAGERVRAEAVAVEAYRDSVLAQWSAARCASPFTAHGPRGEASVRRLADAAAAARIRGVVLTRARALGFDAAPDWLVQVWLASASGKPDRLSSGVRVWPSPNGWCVSS